MIEIQNQNWQSTLPTQQNWDSYGGQPTTAKAINAMRTLLSQRPAIVPLSNGGLQLEWRETTIEIAPDGTIVEE